MRVHHSSILYNNQMFFVCSNRTVRSPAFMRFPRWPRFLGFLYRRSHKIRTQPPPGRSGYFRGHPRAPFVNRHTQKRSKPWADLSIDTKYRDIGYRGHSTSAGDIRYQAASCSPDNHLLPFGRGSAGDQDGRRMFLRHWSGIRCTVRFVGSTYGSRQGANVLCHQILT